MASPALGIAPVKPSRKPQIMVVAALAGVLAVYIVLSILAAVTRRPLSDEGWFASPAITLLNKGYMGTLVIDPGIGLTGIDRRTYWVMPLHLVVQAGWYKLFGAGILQLRALSIFWGAVGLLALFVLVWRLTGDALAATAAAALCGTDYAYITVAALGRMDMMAAALGFTGLAIYCQLRERNFRAAILLAHISVAAAVFTHPHGILYFAGLLFLMFSLDRGRLRLGLLAAAATPYLAAGICWGLYILQAPGDFVAQIRWNAQGRFSGLSAPLAAIKGEIVERYMTAYGLGPHSGGVQGPVALKALVLLVYAGAAGLLLANRKLRNHSGCRMLLGLTGVTLTIMTFFNQKLVWYLVHITPLYASLTAVALAWLYYRRRGARLVAVLCFAGMLALQCGGALLRARLKLYQRQYTPAAEFVARRLRPGTTIIASADLAFGIGFDKKLNDDSTLGFDTHQQPDLIVVDELYAQDFRDHKVNSPPIYAHIERTLSHYTLIYDRDLYKVYERRP